VAAVAVEMGRPRLARGEIPMTGPPGERVLRSTLRARDRTFTFTAVSMGNPHAVVFVDEPEADLRALAEAYGPTIELHELFPRKTNVEIARARPGPSGPEIDLVVWERGVGITLACGTGACATAVAACLEGRAEAGREIPVHLPGGTLGITVEPSSPPAADGFQGVTMRGPAEIVFEAEVDTSQALRWAR
jgi:diaminopimelate epimerase